MMRRGAAATKHPRDDPRSAGQVAKDQESIPVTVWAERLCL